MSKTKNRKPSSAHKVNNKLIVERRPEDDFADRKGNSERTRESNPRALAAVERFRNTTAEEPDQWR